MLSNSLRPLLAQSRHHFLQYRNEHSSSKQSAKESSIRLNAQRLVSSAKHFGPLPFHSSIVSVLSIFPTIDNSSGYFVNQHEEAEVFLLHLTQSSCTSCLSFSSFPRFLRPTCTGRIRETLHSLDITMPSRLDVSQHTFC